MTMLSLVTSLYSLCVSTWLYFKQHAAQCCEKDLTECEQSARMGQWLSLVNRAFVSAQSARNSSFPLGA